MAEAFAGAPGLAEGDRCRSGPAERQWWGIALGHPLGASGAKLMTTMMYALRARGLRYGWQTMCEGGGLANVTIVEALH